MFSPECRCPFSVECYGTNCSSGQRIFFRRVLRSSLYMSAERFSAIHPRMMFFLRVLLYEPSKEHYRRLFSRVLCHETSEYDGDCFPSIAAVRIIRVTLPRVFPTLKLDA